MYWALCGPRKKRKTTTSSKHPSLIILITQVHWQYSKCWSKIEEENFSHLVLSQHFYSWTFPRQPWQDIDGPPLLSRLHFHHFFFFAKPSFPPIRPTPTLPLSQPAHPSLCTGQRVQTPGGEELSGSLSAVLLPLTPRDCRVQTLEGLIENKTKLKQRDAALLCAQAVNISEWLSCVLLASTLFVRQPCREGLLVAGRR